MSFHDPLEGTEISYNTNTVQRHAPLPRDAGRVPYRIRPLPSCYRTGNKPTPPADVFPPAPIPETCGRIPGISVTKQASHTSGVIGP